MIGKYWISMVILSYSATGNESKAQTKARDLGIEIGVLPPEKYNSITGVEKGMKMMKSYRKND